MAEHPDVVLDYGDTVVVRSKDAAIKPLEYHANADKDRVRVTAPPRPAEPPPASGDYLLIAKADLLRLPTTGKAWDGLLSWSNRTVSSPSISDQEDPDNVIVLAKALVAARTGDAAKRSQVEAALVAVQSSSVGRALALGRELGAYVLAADLIGYRTPAFVAWVSRMQTVATSDGPASLRKCHEERPNNWGTWAGAARVISDLYVGDKADLVRAVQVWKGWLGDRTAYAGFKYGDTSWQADPSKPVGINPKGATKQGISIDGVLPDDQRRGGGFTTNPPCENYVHEALQGVTLALLVLHRSGTDLWPASDSAVRRAFDWLYAHGCPSEGDDTTLPWIVNRFTGTRLPTVSPTSPGKGFLGADWLYG